MYRSFFLSLALLACASFLTATTASAQITFTLNSVGLNVSGTAAGSLTGTFETNSNTITSSSTLLTYNIVAPSTGVIAGHAFAGFTYTPSDSSVVYTVGASGLLTGFEIDAPAGDTTSNAADAIRFYFSTNLSATGSTGLNVASPSAISYENEHNSGGTRTVDAGATVSAAPEPSAWTLAFLATTLFAGLRLRSRIRRA